MTSEASFDDLSSGQPHNLSDFILKLRTQFTRGIGEYSFKRENRITNDKLHRLLTNIIYYSFIKR